MNIILKRTLGASLFTIAFSFIIPETSAQSCATPPTCSQLGYSMSVSDCDGYSYLRCPFDIDNDSAVFCSKSCSCNGVSSPDLCPNYSQTIKGECNNTCYVCWNGTYFVQQITVFCHYTTQGYFIKATTPPIMFTCSDRNGNYIDNIMLAPAEIYSPGKCPAPTDGETKTSYTIENYHGFCNGQYSFTNPFTALK